MYRYRYTVKKIYIYIHLSFLIMKKVHLIEHVSSSSFQPDCFQAWSEWWTHVPLAHGPPMRLLRKLWWIKAKLCERSWAPATLDGCFMIPLRVSCMVMWQIPPGNSKGLWLDSAWLWSSSKIRQLIQFLFYIS